MIAWNDLGKMLSFYLYGTDVPPENYEDRLRERPIGNVSLEIDSVDYMVNGAGRYAYASQAQVVQDFFNVTTIIPDGSYTKEQMVELFGYPEQTSNFDNWHFAFSQSGVDSASDDYGLRSLMYN